MTHKKAQGDIRRRQTEVAHRFLADKRSATANQINCALEAAGLPPTRTDLELDNVLNDRDFEPADEQVLAAISALQAKVVVNFLREGNYHNLLDAMTKLNLTEDELQAMLAKQVLAKLGDRNH